MCFQKAPTTLKLYVYSPSSRHSQQPTQKRLQVTEAKFETLKLLFNLLKTGIL